jgi:hypothetical protein
MIAQPGKTMPNSTARSGDAIKRAATARAVYALQ